MRFHLSTCGRVARPLLCLTLAAVIGCVSGFRAVYAAAAPEADSTKGEPNIYELRHSLYKEIGMLTNVPWHWLAAVDQYERTITPRKKGEEDNKRLIGISFKDAFWTGTLNPDSQDMNPASIALFGGVGKDANADGIADPQDDSDALYTLASYLSSGGYEEEDFRIALWRYYQSDSAVTRIRQFSKMFNTFGPINFLTGAFPLPVRSTYTYKDTWGDRRGWGGLRTHEGTDLFAPYGVTVRSVCYGIIETKGWNPYGGWRIGIRDLQNRYHYFAHLQGYEKGIEVGETIEPGKTIGWVGSSGYGPPGTQGRFPPHLHYGIYRDTGSTEWAFNPYPLLKQWERTDRQKKKGSS